MNGGERIDSSLFLRGLCESREKAKAIVMAGQVYLNGIKEMKPGTRIKDDDSLEVRGASSKYVSRGGFKLEKALTEFHISIENEICMDVGASTGGFTDCMLQNGAARVYAVDVGYGQFAWKLRTDERVVVLERTNFRYITGEQVPEPIDFASVDVSFISLKLILPVLAPMLSKSGRAVVLIKPQFEAGREKVGKKGVVRDEKVHLEVINGILGFAPAIGLTPVGLDFSPIKGPEGNIEYLCWLKNCLREIPKLDPEGIVKASHEAL